MNSRPSQSVRLIFAGGGTGGHLFPAIAIADRVTDLWSDERKLEIAFVGTKRGLEYRIRERLGYPLHLLNVKGLARRITLQNLLVPFIFIGSLVKATMLLNNFAPHMIIGTGGYVAMPILKMAAVKKIPFVIQEQNSYPGLTTRRTAWSAKKVYLGFAAAQDRISSQGGVIVSGNPVRHSLNQADREVSIKSFGLDPARQTLLVVGGSQGARGINQALTKSLMKNSLSEKYQLLWLTGKGAYQEVTRKLGGKVSGHALIPYAEDMAAVYAASDFAIARAGAITIAELQATEIPSILIPYPHAAGDHQRKNADEYAAHGFAEVIDEFNLDKEDILSRAVALLESEKFINMKAALKKQAVDHLPAVDLIASDIINLALSEADGGGR